VDAVTEALRSVGCAAPEGPRRPADGYHESVVLDLERIRIDLTA